MTYELADGRLHQYDVGLVQIEFMGSITAWRVVFGAEDIEPILGVTALESSGSSSTRSGKSCADCPRFRFAGRRRHSRCAAPRRS